MNHWVNGMLVANPNSRRCRIGWHNWSIYTWPIMVRWCYRCGKRDPK